jgi:fatty acid desaturase
LSVLAYTSPVAAYPADQPTGNLTTTSSILGGPRPRTGSSFTALTRQVHELGLMRRRYSYYWAKLIGAVLMLAAWVAGFVWIGDSWWQLASAGLLAVIMTQTAFLGHDAAHRQMFKSGRWNDWISLIVANLLVGISYGWWQSKHTRHHANPNKDGADPDIALSAIAMTPERATRHRSPLMRWLVAHQGWYFFPLLLLEGLSLHIDGIRRVASRQKVERRWVELTFLTVRLGGLAALVFWVLPPEKAIAVLAVQLAVFGFYMGFSFAPNHIGMPLVSPKLKLDFLRRQVLMSRNIAGGPLMSIFMGGSTTKSSTTSSRQWPGRISARFSRWWPRIAPPKACRTPRPVSGRPTGVSSATSTPLGSKARTRSFARSSPNAEQFKPQQTQTQTIRPQKCRHRRQRRAARRTVTVTACEGRP